MLQKRKLATLFTATFCIARAINLHSPHLRMEMNKKIAHCSACVIRARQAYYRNALTELRSPAHKRWSRGGGSFHAVLVRNGRMTEER